MNKTILILISLLIMMSFVSATDPKITNVTNTQAYVNQATTFTVSIDANDTNGVIRFVDNDYLITQQFFNPTNQEITFNYTWNVKELRNVRFYITDLNDVTQTY